MDVNLSEEEQVEALKKWWRENGKSLIGGVVIGLGVVFGWRAWVDHNESVAAQVSYQYDQLNKAMQVGATDSATKLAEQIIAQHSDHTYAVLAALNLAKLKLEQGDSAGAQVDLKWAIEQSQDEGVSQVASLRLARILLNDGDLAGAEAIAAANHSASFSGEWSELKGDLALAKGDMDAARAAYTDALTQNQGNTVIIRMKLDDIAASNQQ